MKWYDPHFHLYDSHGNHVPDCENNASSIIAVFDIDHNTVNRYLYEGWSNLYMYCFALPVLIHPEAIISKAIVIALIIVLMIYQKWFHDKCLRYNLIHIAIATDGIYIDERDTMNNNNPVRYCRTIIPYDAIHQCHIRVYNYSFRKYVHVVFLDVDGKIINSLLNCFYNIHQFVDLVNVMMTTTTTTATKSFTISSTTSSNTTTQPVVSLDGRPMLPITGNTTQTNGSSNDMEMA
jgi:hypothetical protein